MAESNAKRYPVEISSEVTPQLHGSLEDVAIAENNIQAQVTLNIFITTQSESKPFELSYKIIGSFVCTPDVPRNVMLQFLHQGSLGVLLPFARELLMNLCTRLILLPMIQLSLSPSEEMSSEGPHDLPHK